MTKETKLSKRSHGEEPREGISGSLRSGAPVPRVARHRRPLGRAGQAAFRADAGRPAPLSAERDAGRAPGSHPGRQGAPANGSRDGRARAGLNQTRKESTMRSWIGRSVLPARLTSRCLLCNGSRDPASAATTDNGSHREGGSTMFRAKAVLTGLVMLAMIASLATGATGADTIKIAYIDPLSGPFAATGENGLQQFKFAADHFNRAGGVLGQKFEVIGYDNKVSPQEALIQLKKVIGDGISFVFQGNSSGVAHAISDAVLKHNERNPSARVLYLNYSAVDPALTNEKCPLLALPLRRPRGHEDGRPDRRDQDQHQDQEDVYHRPGLLVREGGGRGRGDDAQGEAPGHPDRGQRAAPDRQGPGLLPVRARRSSPPAPMRSSPATGAPTWSTWPRRQTTAGSRSRSTPTMRPPTG